MKKTLGLLAAVAAVSACQTTPTRAINVANEYTAPAETADAREQMRPALTEWCDDYLNNMEGAVLSCKLISDVMLFSIRLKPRYEWDASGIEATTDGLSDWACQAFEGPFAAGYAFATNIDGTTKVKVTTRETCAAKQG
ncbi:hypothetical protein [Reinekea marinisedimentorum]|uniref:Lipoprotein n=1 Tax=Reinekea marinisedimentorum TaxID=230495 RepID=A0A4R3I2L4_9GAMM|nr:hypothetical protein [Reinekea marinisedimentorum]TCS38139.1 hypothetical protein BCF53_11767 [Reinekea marinisedimentorum]